MNTLKKALSFLLLISCSNSFLAQGTIEDYKRSVEVEKLFADKVFNSPVEFHWMDDQTFWYATNTQVGQEYIIVNAIDQKQTRVFDPSLFSEALSELLGKKISAKSIGIDSLSFGSDHTRFTFYADNIKISGKLSGDYELKIIDTFEVKEKEKVYWGRRFDERDHAPSFSPDKAYFAYIKNNNIYIRNIKSQEESQLSFDGSAGFFYSSQIFWSPDSQKILAYKVRPGQEHKIYFIESSPSDQLQPKLRSRDYLKPGDELAFKSPQLFNIQSGNHLKFNTDHFKNQYDLSNFQWNDDSNSFTFEYNQRGHQVYRVLKVDANTGSISVIIEENSPTFIDYSGKRFRHDTKNGDIIWASERDGWNHLYLVDGKSGKTKRITSGEWPVRQVVEVDERKRHIYFTASGLDKDQDPYFVHYFRIDFDGNNFTRLTQENGNHKVFFSPDRQFYVDQYSRVDESPVTLLKQVGRKEPLMELQKGDISELLATGWQKPEPFMAKGRDGKTDIWGIIIRPTDFNPTKTYPIIEYIYAGPHDSFVPKDFNSYYTGMSSLAELGFIVVKIDGMGTSNRSKAFQDIAWKNLKDAGFPDRKLWIRAAAEKYPYMNIDKVGIHGRSAGGQSSSGALIFHNDFYDVAVSSSGCHDNRMDKIWWNEQWMGYPIGPHYAESSNVVNAALLKGKVLLIVGELDENVDPASTFQFAEALIKANKNFDLVIRPGIGHSAGNDDYDQRKRRDFFVEHLLGVTPPEWNEIY